MDAFTRNLSGYPLLDRTAIDSRLSNFQADGFVLEPKVVGWATYGRMKSILIRVLGRKVFDILFRNADNKVDSGVFELASTIVMFYVRRFDPQCDLQTTLISNIVAARCNLSANHRARVFSMCDKMIESCEFDRAYAKHLKNTLVEQKVLSTPWWIALSY